MSKGEQPRALRQSLQKSFATRWPPGRGTFLLEISVMPLSQKPAQKWFLPPRKGVAFLTEAFLKKDFQVPERIPLSALVPANMAAPLPGEAARAPVGWPPTSRRLTSTAALIQNMQPFRATTMACIVYPVATALRAHKCFAPGGFFIRS